MREPLVLDALPEGERSAARKQLMAAIDLLRLEAPGRVRKSWVEAPEPPVNPPPYVHTMTGRRSPADLAGVQTFT